MRVTYIKHQLRFTDKTVEMISSELDIEPTYLSRLFKKLERVTPSEYRKQWPVLFLTLKDVNGSKFEGAYGLLEQSISKLCIEHDYLANSKKITQVDKETFLRLEFRKGSCIDIQCALDTLLRWYDGYLFGGQEIYCPWDVINHVRALMTDPKARPGNYWLDTSHNNIIRRFIDHPQSNVNDKFETLLAGGVIQEPIREDLPYDIANSTESNLWSILYLTGYLTQALPESLPEGMTLADGNTALRIPNEEVKSVFGDTVKKWFEDTITAKDRTALFQAWWDGEPEKLTQEITDILFDTISYFDYKEDYYHAMVTGMFLGAGYAVKSNSEAGTGRVDIIVKEPRRRRALVIKAKWPGKKEKGNSLEKECADALEQIEEGQYAKNLRLEGYTSVLCYGAAFRGKTCLIKVAG